MGKVTMRDIGEAVGVSAVTVCKALAGQPGMSDKTRSRIQKAAEQMGYKYPDTEKTRSRTNLDIGILMPEKYFDPDSFYSVIYRKLVQRLAMSGHFGLLELLSEETENALELPNLVKTRHVDGLIILGEPGRDYYRMIASQDFPVVFLDFYDEHCTADAVVGDNTYGCYRLTSHLIRNGHTKIGFVGNYRATSSIMDRYLGFCRAMLSHDLRIRPEWVLPDRDLHSGLILPELPAEMPTAFVCNCDLIARQLINRLREAGYKVPEQVSVTGFDDYIAGDEHNNEISTFRMDLDSMIELAIKAITERCSGSQKPFGRTVVSGQPIYRLSETVCPERE